MSASEVGQLRRALLEERLGDWPPVRREPYTLHAPPAASFDALCVRIAEEVRAAAQQAEAGLGYEIDGALRVAIANTQCSQSSGCHWFTVAYSIECAGAGGPSGVAAGVAADGDAGGAVSAGAGVAAGGAAGAAGAGVAAGAAGAAGVADVDEVDGGFLAGLLRDKAARPAAEAQMRARVAREVDVMMDNGVRAHPLLRCMYDDRAAAGGDAEAAGGASGKRRVEFAAEASGPKRPSGQR